MKKSLLLATLLAAFGAPAMAATFIVEYASPSTPSGIALPSVPPATLGANRAPGLYVQVLDGMIQVATPGGSLEFAAGQFGFVSSLDTPPSVIPATPGMQFTPPPAFSSSATGTTLTSGVKSNTVDCVVR